MGEEEELIVHDDGCNEAVRLANALDVSDDELRLLMGELTAEEIRLVRAVINWAQRRILYS